MREEKKPPGGDVQLTEEQIRTVAAGWDAADVEQILAMRSVISFNDFRDWLNAVGYIQVLQNALAFGDHDAKKGLYNDCIVRR